MKISILQHDIRWANPAENVRRLDAMLSLQPCADLYVLAEMFSTGFATRPQGIAETDDSETLHWMVRKAKELNAALAGSLAISSNGFFYNRLYFVRPDGKIEHYDKHHLFSYSGEDKQFSQGSRRVVVNYRGVRILLGICYDLRFPVWVRNRNDYDAMLIVASWPQTRVEAWSALLRARAIENQCYVIGVNRVGDDPSCHYNGASAIIDPYGTTIAECEQNQECSAVADVDLNTLNAFRDKFPVLDDADDFTLN